MKKSNPNNTLADELCLKLRERFVENVAYAGLFVTAKAHGMTLTQEHIKPYTDALNAANKALWSLLWRAQKANQLAKPPGKAPMASYDPNKKCDGRCWSAVGYECVCKCGGAFHGMGMEAVKAAMGGSF